MSSSDHLNMQQLQKQMTSNRRKINNVEFAYGGTIGPDSDPNHHLVKKHAKLKTEGQALREQYRSAHE